MTTNTTLTRLQQLLPHLFQSVQVSGDPYLRFQLTPETPALISMKWVQEALLVSASSISPLPNMPVFSIGIMSSRDRVFLVVDLGQLLGLAPLPVNPRSYQVITIHLPSVGTENRTSSEKYLGLAVQRVGGVARFGTKPLPLVAEECSVGLVPYSLGSFMEKNKKILVLNTEVIIASPLLTTNPINQVNYQE